MEIDPRGPRFGALVTLVVFVVVLITGSVWLLAAQGLVFAAGVTLGLPRSPYGLLYRWLIRPRLGPPAELEPAAPPRFAQGGPRYQHRRRDWLCDGRDRARPGRRCCWSARGVPQRGLRALPWLRDVSAIPPNLAGPGDYRRGPYLNKEVPDEPI
jgi:hypothetical protein